MNVDNFRLPEQPRHSGCPTHPDESVTGVCASCLRERLAVFDPETRRVKPSGSGGPASSVAASLRAGIFRGGRAAVAGIAPELRRTRSFSVRGRSECSTSGHVEPQRKSCDVRVRNTLWSLFHLDDENAVVAREACGEIEPERRSNAGGGAAGFVRTVFENREEEEAEEEREKAREEARVPEREARAPEEEVMVSEGADRVEEFCEMRTMKAHIDLDSRVAAATKKQPTERGKDAPGGFWLASVFTKRIQKWRRKHRSKKPAAAAVASSEITETARRSCDTEPRFSIDAGRNSWDLPRFSLDEPRASWDGYLIGRVFSRPIVSGGDDTFGRADNLIPVQEDAVTPGGATQTRDYYSDSSSSQRRRKSFSKNQQMAGEEVPTVSCNAPTRSSLAISDDFQGSSANFCDYSLRDDFSGSFGDIGDDSKRLRKSRRWSIWGFIHRKAKEDDRDCRSNGIERSFSESWQELRREVNGGHFSGLNHRDFRCNSSVSSRSSRSRGSFGDYRNHVMDVNGSSGFSKASSNKKKKKKRDEAVLDRNRSARYSPSHIDNGLLRFYLTPLRSSRKGGSMGNGRVKNAHSFARSVLRLY
ncbi:UPF0503 protein [Nymphaea thermarum]|nr:UPF0503 protein [Nymphaea thermarum]